MRKGPVVRAHKLVELELGVVLLLSKKVFVFTLSPFIFCIALRVLLLALLIEAADRGLERVVRLLERRERGRGQRPPAHVHRHIFLVVAASFEDSAAAPLRRVQRKVGRRLDGPQLLLLWKGYGGLPFAVTRMGCSKTMLFIPLITACARAPYQWYWDWPCCWN